MSENTVNETPSTDESTKVQKAAAVIGTVATVAISYRCARKMITRLKDHRASKAERKLADNVTDIAANAA